jgi:hypothetical protein
MVAGFAADLRPGSGISETGKCIKFERIPAAVKNL